MAEVGSNSTKSTSSQGKSANRWRPTPAYLEAQKKQRRIYREQSRRVVEMVRRGRDAMEEMEK